ncbi:AmmeMemoRadiSam system protein B [Candidatus Parcubacteria bacterium]|nr:MAG: AmmeMemoRadiSam system protein B [Candidatus Parcubacteria bacterium]
MSIVFSAILPHPPILIPQIGKENIGQLEKTLQAIEKLRKDFIDSGAETIMIISPHGIIQNDAFTMNLCPEFKCDFEDFGDFSTKCTWPGNVGLSHKLREALEVTAPLQLISEENLDYGTSVPLCVLTEGKPNLKLIPLYYSGLNNEAHYKFGQVMKKELLKRREPVAIIASGDLSHRLEKNAPGGYSSKGKKFDNRLIKLLQEKNIEKIINMDEGLIVEAGECGLKSILILLGILDDINYNPKLLSYEAPFGVGYMTMNFKF